MDLGFTEKAFRQYLAPERLGDNAEVVPVFSDMFSMGVVLAELLQGNHPVKNVEKLTKSRSAWRRFFSDPDYDLKGVSSEIIKKLILSCLETNPKNRPTPEEAIDTICLDLNQRLGEDIGATLDLWGKIANPSIASQYEHSAWASRRTVGLGGEQEALSIVNLEHKIQKIIVKDLETL